MPPRKEDCDGGGGNGSSQVDGVSVRHIYVSYAMLGIGYAFSLVVLSAETAANRLWIEIQSQRNNIIMKYRT